MKPETLSFRGLQNYTTLKHAFDDMPVPEGFRGLQNYTTLKLCFA